MIPTSTSSRGPRDLRNKSAPFRLAVATAAAATLTGCASAAASGGHSAAAATRGTTITFNAAQCGGQWHAAPGLRTFEIRNESAQAAEVYLVNPRTYAIFGALDGIGAGTTSTMAVNLGSGPYAFRCVLDDVDPFSGPTVTIGGHAKGEPGIVPVTNNELIGPSKVYHAYVTVGLAQLETRPGSTKTSARAS